MRSISLASLFLLTAAIGAAETAATPTVAKPTETTAVPIQRKTVTKVMPVAAPAGYETVTLPCQNGAAGTSVPVHRIAASTTTAYALSPLGVRVAATGALVPAPWTVTWRSRWVSGMAADGSQPTVGVAYEPIVRDGTGQEHDGLTAWAVVAAAEVRRPADAFPDLTDWTIKQAFEVVFVEEPAGK